MEHGHVFAVASVKAGPVAFGRSVSEGGRAAGFAGAAASAAGAQYFYSERLVHFCAAGGSGGVPNVWGRSGKPGGQESKSMVAGPVSRGIGRRELIGG